MATVNPTQEEQQKGEQTPAGGPVNVTGTAGASGATGQGTAGNAAGASPVAANTAPQASQGYTDVASYLDANKGGSQQLGQQVGQELTNKYNETKGAIGNSANDVINAVNQGYTKSNTDLINQVAANPEAAAASPEQTSAFQAQLNDTYSGPTNWADLGTQQGNVATAQQYGGLTKTPGGLNVLTQGVEGPTASQGVNQLDTLLLGGSPEAMQTIQSAADPYATLTDYLNQQNQTIQQGITTGQTEAQNAAQAANDAFLGTNGVATNFNTGLQNQLTAAQQAAANQNAAISQALMQENVTPEQLQALGMTADQWTALKDQLNLAQNSRTVSSNPNRNQVTVNTGTSDIQLPTWLTQQDPYAAITMANEATNPEYARSAALQTLLGSKYNAPLNQADIAQAGTAPTNLNTFDYNTALQTTQQTQQAELAAAQAYADALQAGNDEQHAQLAAENARKNMIIGAVSTAGMSLPTIAAANALAPQFNSVSNAGKTIGANIATGGMYTPAKAAVDTVKSLFCFHEDTPVDMLHGGTKCIKNIELGDKTLGGEVLAITRAMASDLFWLDGILVTSKHAVYYNHKWQRVGDVKEAKRIDGTYKVYNLVTTNHRIWVNGMMTADEYECDQYEYLTIDESLQVLNGLRKVS